LRKKVRITLNPYIIKGIIKSFVFILGIVAMCLGIFGRSSGWLLVAIGSLVLQVFLSNLEGW